MSYFQFLYVYYKLKEKEKLSKESVTEMDTFDLAKTSSEKSWSLLQKMVLLFININLLYNMK